MVQRRWVGAKFCAVLVALISSCLPLAASAAVELTSTERTWLEAALPVLSFAQDQGLPLDIVVQPQLTPGQTPLGMAFVDGRCKLVLSMRGNDEAQATLDRMPADLVGPIVESIAAHELGHCWRHLRKDWGTLPAGLQDVTIGGVTAEQITLLRDMWQVRREEAYADMVGLAWTMKHHRARFVEVHAWYVRLRAEQAIDTGPHDTRRWVQLAGDPAQFQPAASIFEQAEPLWIAGLLAGN